MARTLRGDIVPVQALERPPLPPQHHPAIHRGGAGQRALPGCRVGAELAGDSLGQHRHGFFTIPTWKRWEPPFWPSPTETGSWPERRPAGWRTGPGGAGGNSSATFPVPPRPSAARPRKLRDPLSCWMWGTTSVAAARATPPSCWRKSFASRPRGPWWCCTIPRPFPPACEGASASRSCCRWGAKSDGIHGRPLRVSGRIRSIADGRSTESRPRHGGSGVFRPGRDSGAGNLAPKYSGADQFSNGPPKPGAALDPGAQAPNRRKSWWSKGAVAPRAAYEPIARRTILVDTPGATSANPAHFSYRNLRRSLYPLQENLTYPE